jgi:hypothetical protein
MRSVLDPFPTAKTSQVCKKILSKKLFLEDFGDSITHNNDQKAAKTKSLIFTIYGRTAHIPSFSINNCQLTRTNLSF